MKPIAFLFAFFGSFLLTSAPRHSPVLSLAPAVNLIENGTAKGVIVLPTDATKLETFAAEEIQTTLEKMSGAKVPITTEMPDANTPALILGHRAENDAALAQLQKQTSQNEAFALIPAQNRVSIVANGQSAVVYGAWEFLERQGVKWIMPTEHGTFIPHKTTVSLPTETILEKPGFAFRGPGYVMLAATQHPESANIIEHGIPGSVLLGYRWRLNYNLDLDPADAWRDIGNGHSYAQYLPPANYFAAHPEWFSLVNGKRTDAEGLWQVCFTNEDAAKEFAKNQIEEAKRFLAQGFREERLRFWVSPNDWRTGCECENCAKLRDTDGATSSMVTHFANRVAAEIAKVYPKARICFYAYDSYSHPPEHARPAANVSPEITFWTAAISFNANNAKPMLSDGNAKFRDWFGQWLKLSPGGVSVHGYYGHWVTFTPFPQVTQLLSDVPKFAKMSNLYGMTSEDRTHWGTQLPNLYLGAKLRWNPNLNAKKTLDEFYTAGFGAAAPAIRGYFETLQKQMDATEYLNGYLSEVPKILTPGVISRCDALIAQAENLLPQMDEDTRWRTRIVIEGWKISAETAHALTLYLAPTDPTRDAVPLIANLKSLQTRLKSETGLYAVERRVADTSLNSTLKAVAVPIDTLPVGDNLYSDLLNYGGALKFRGKVSGLRINGDGYALAGGASGSIEIPFGAEAGHRITKFALKTGFVVTDPARFEVKIEWVSANGETATLAANVRDAEGLMTATSGVPTTAGTLKITMKNLTAQEYTAIAWLTARLEIE